MTIAFAVILINGCRTSDALAEEPIRLATFNVALTRDHAGQLQRDLLKGDRQARAIAHIIQAVRPDILLLNEFDYDAQHHSVQCFRDRYLAVAQGDGKPICYPYYYAAAVNTGVPSGCDLDNDGRTDGPADGYGYGAFPGRYGMLLLSRYPLQRDAIRTFQRFLWKDMPQAGLPDNPATSAPQDWYTPQELAVFRLSSKSHWDIPVKINGRTLHLLLSHPTPPVFDGPEDRNGKRNHDEIRLWADYITPGKAEYIVDDKGVRGGLPADAAFVIMGDLNADPYHGDSAPAAINQLLRHSRIQDPMPHSPGAQGGQGELARSARRRYDTYQSLPGQHPGNLRLDYVLPSADLSVLDARVVWPVDEQALSESVGFSDHRMVYVDIQMQGDQ